jgi:hypothetical protein
MVRGNRQVVNPPAKSVKASQNGSNNTASQFSHEKEIALHSQFPLDHECRVVPRRVIGKDRLPERDDRRFVFLTIWPNQQRFSVH